MPELALAPRFGLEHLALPGPRGAPVGEAGIDIALRADLALVAVIARKDQHHALARRINDVFGLALPMTPRRIAAGPIAFAWAGPGQWLASAEGMDGTAFEARLRRELTGMASVSDQSDGRVVFRVGGPKARDALVKGVMIDLHPRAFQPGDTAVTSVAHIGVHFWHADSVPTYEFAVFRSFGAAFWDWLIASAAEFGVAIR